MGEGPSAPVYSFVIPLYNEELVLPILFHRLDGLLARLDGPAEVILVDDGSRDASGVFAAGRAKDDPRFRYVGLAVPLGLEAVLRAAPAARTRAAMA